MADIIISFIHEEQAVAMAVQKILQTSLGLQQAICLSADTWQIFAGEIWLDRLKDELASAKI